MDLASKRKWVLVVVGVAVFMAISAVARLYIDWLWFKGLNFSQVFTITLATKWGLGAAVLILTFIFFFLNLMLTRGYSRDLTEYSTEDGREIIFNEPPPWKDFIKSKAAVWIFVLASLLAALMVASAIAGKWIVFQQFFHAMPFGLKDPIFQKDIGFYVFHLNFYKTIYGLIMPTLVLTTLGVGLVYLLTATFDFLAINWREFNWPKVHIAVLLALIFLVKSWGYRLASYSILYSPEGVVFGAGYADVHARLLAYKVLLVITALVAVVILLNIFVRRMSWIFIGIGIWVGVAVILGGVYPGIMQKLSVEPNEFNREKPYIENSIKYTRAAYGLDKIENQTFKTTYDLKWNDLQNNQPTVQNIRLWDWQPLQKTYKAIQEIRPYYKFNDIDIDRYMINGEYRQVMLAARELSQENLPTQAQTWVNKRLKYTHGYGLAMSPVNEVAQEGLPVLFVKDIPPKSTVGLQIDRPEIYYGEEPSSYVIVNTKTTEFDYPMGNKNAYTTYQEKSGVKIGSFGRRIILAAVCGDYKMLLSSDVTSESQILIYRDIRERVERIAPFLQYDGDPYAVVSEGRVYWIIDAYTYTHMYPYSEPTSNKVNYIRNSVKVVVDAYNGNTTFYLADSQDPIARSYAAIFPGLFKPMEKMPTDLLAHVRYPADLFSIQANIYSLYHMTDPWVFYNKEDKWNIPQEIFGSEREKEQLQPYYIVMRLPDQEKSEYILMIPFTPNTKENMISWLCARSDGENYGKLRVYDFSKQELIYGPMQVESRINQNSEISQQFALWDQKGSRVFRGNLLVIPIDNSILYIEPIYMQAEQSQIPELRRIVAIFGDKVVMEQTLNEALKKVVAPGPGKTEPTTTPVPGDTIKSLAEQAYSYYKKAENAIKSGNWADYGNNMKSVGDLLERLTKE